MKIVAISAPFPGVSRVFEEAEKLGLLEFIQPTQGNRIWIPTADVYIFGAWHPIYDNAIKALSGSRVGVLWTSSVGELGFESVEQDYLQRIISDDRIEFVWFGDRSLAEVYSKGFYIPYPMQVKNVKLQPKENIVTLFCPNTAKKNILNQLYAIALLQRESSLILHTNVPIEARFAKDIGLKYVQHQWLERDVYDKIIASSKLNFAVSWAETNNYQVAEAVLLGTVSIGTATIPFLPADMCVWNPNSPLGILELAIRLLYDERHKAQYLRGEVVKYFADANAVVEDRLSQLLAPVS